MTDCFDNAPLVHVPAASVSGAAKPFLTTEIFETARKEILNWRGYAPTPLLSLRGLARSIDVERIYYKDESSRFGLGSFRALGGAYAALGVLQRELTRQLGSVVLSEEIRGGGHAGECSQITLVAASDSEHGPSLAWGCRRFGAQCRIYVHTNICDAQERAMRGFGAEVIRIDGDHTDAVNCAQNAALEKGCILVPETVPESDVLTSRDMLAGYGVMAREICEATPLPPTHAFVQGNESGLAASVAEFFAQRWGKAAPRLIVVEPDGSAPLTMRARHGHPQIASDSAAAMEWDILQHDASDFVTVPDDLTGPVIRQLAAGGLGDAPLHAGENAVLGMAALIAACRQPEIACKLGLNETSRVLLIGSEGVSDLETFEAILAS